MRRYREPSMNQASIAGGLLLGSAMGAAAIFLTKTYKGKAILRNLSYALQEISARTKEASMQMSAQAAKGCPISQRLFRREEYAKKEEGMNLALGGVVGGALGLAAAYLLTSDSSKGLRENLADNLQCLSEKTQGFAQDFHENAKDVADTLEERFGGWVDVAQRFIDNLNANAQSQIGSAKRRFLEEDHSFDKVVDWAALGIRLYQSLKK